MRRTIFGALLAALLLFVPAARAGQSSIYKDCQDGRLDSHYTLQQLRNAKANLPSDVDEYSDCRDVLSRAIAQLTASKPSSNGGDNGGGTSTGGGGGGGSTGGGGGSGSGATNGSSGSPDTTSQAPVTPATPQDQAALTQAATQGSAPVNLDGGKIVPGGQGRLAADVGRNSLPAPLVIVLILLALAAVGGAAWRMRNRGVPHTQP